MKKQVIELMKNRRSIYNIGKNVSLSQDEISELVKEAVKESPSSFNSQTARAVVLFGASHNRLWDSTDFGAEKSHQGVPIPLFRGGITSAFSLLLRTFVRMVGVYQTTERSVKR